MREIRKHKEEETKHWVVGWKAIALQIQAHSVHPKSNSVAESGSNLCILMWTIFSATYHCVKLVWIIEFPSILVVWVYVWKLDFMNQRLLLTIFFVFTCVWSFTPIMNHDLWKFAPHLRIAVVAAMIRRV